MTELIAMVAFVAVVMWLAGPRVIYKMPPLHTAFTVTAAGIVTLDQEHS